MPTVVVTGAASAWGARAMDDMRRHPGIDLHDESSGVDVAQVMVHLGAGDHDTRARRRENVTVGTADMLERADALGARHVVLVSSAMVYGAWPNNPVPLTEDAPLRPDPEFTYARQLASVEQMVDDWRRARPGRTATVLRPVVAVAAHGTSTLARALAAGMGQHFAEDDPAAQFVHLDDLAAAVTLGAAQELDGVYNVAPDGSIPAERVRALSGARRIPLPTRLAEVVTMLRWRFQRGPIPPGLRSYARSPWLVANDRLKARGWAPTVSNEQAYVEGTEAKWWTMVTPKRKQEVALVAMVTVAVGALGAVGLAVRRARRRQRSARA